jgi:hypothetical protein
LQLLLLLMGQKEKRKKEGIYSIPYWIPHGKRANTKYWCRVVLYLYDEPPISGEKIIIRTISVLILVSHVNGIGNMVPRPFLQKKN